MDLEFTYMGRPYKLAGDKIFFGIVVAGSFKRGDEHPPGSIQETIERELSAESEKVIDLSNYRRGRR